jgi:hypothetical protein
MLKIALSGIMLGVGLLTLLFYAPQFSSRLAEKVAGILNPYSDGTASWRIAGWRYQLGELVESGQVLFGEGLGSYYSWEFRGTEITFSPHNAYVQMVLKFGLLGLVIYGLLVREFISRAGRYRKRLSRGPMAAYVETGILNFTAGHAYMLGYGIVPVMLFFFALTLCATRVIDNVTRRSPVYVGPPRRSRWLANVSVPTAPMPAYKR